MGIENNSPLTIFRVENISAFMDFDNNLPSLYVDNNSFDKKTFDNKTFDKKSFVKKTCNRGLIIGPKQPVTMRSRYRTVLYLIRDLSTAPDIENLVYGVCLQ